MAEGYNFDFSDLEEYFVDYVDGSMDPKVKDAFEEFLRSNPDASVQIADLLRVRTQLCSLGSQCQCSAPEGFQSRLYSKLRDNIACEFIPVQSAFSQFTPGLNVVARSMSLVLVFVALGICWTSLNVSSGADSPQENLAPDLMDQKAPYRYARLDVSQGHDYFPAVLINANSINSSMGDFVPVSDNMTLQPTLMVQESRSTYYHP